MVSLRCVRIRVADPFLADVYRIQYLCRLQLIYHGEGDQDQRQFFWRPY